jgi:hypothetical protein
MLLEGRASSDWSEGRSSGRVLAGVTPDWTKAIGILTVAGTWS